MTASATSVQPQPQPQPGAAQWDAAGDQALEASSSCGSGDEGEEDLGEAAEAASCQDRVSELDPTSGCPLSINAFKCATCIMMLCIDQPHLSGILALCVPEDQSVHPA